MFSLCVTVHTIYILWLCTLLYLYMKQKAKSFFHLFIFFHFFYVSFCFLYIFGSFGIMPDEARLWTRRYQISEGFLYVCIYIYIYIYIYIFFYIKDF